LRMSRFQRRKLDERVEALYLRHVTEAGDPDRKVALQALAVVHACFQQHHYCGDDRRDFLALVDCLERLRDGYSDPAGIYSSGRGNIGSFLIDFRALRREIWPLRWYGATLLQSLRRLRQGS